MPLREIEARVRLVVVDPEASDALACRPDQRGQRTQVLRPEDEIDPREAREQSVRLLLRHAATDAEDQARTLLLETAKRPQL